MSDLRVWLLHDDWGERYWVLAATAAEARRHVNRELRRDGAHGPAPEATDRPSQPLTGEELDEVTVSLDVTLADLVAGLPPAKPGILASTAWDG